MLYGVPVPQKTARGKVPTIQVKNVLCEELLTPSWIVSRPVVTVLQAGRSTSIRLGIDFWHRGIRFW